MIGGLSKTTSLAALLAAAGFLAAGASANAADLGGNCCADLEERIAELEATTARKGNRKVSLTVSGQVNEAVMFWDDGVESNAYVATNEVARSRFRFLGSAKIDSKWTAGYLMEIGVRGNKQNDLGADVSSSGKGLDVRHSAWYLKNADLGTVWLGQTSNSVDGITEVNLANVGHFAGPSQLGLTLQGFKLRKSSTGALSTNTVKGFLTAGPDSSNPGEGSRYNLVKYDTPTLAGFTGSVSWGEDDQWDVALRYAGEFSGIKLAAGIGYEKSNDGTTNPRVCSKVAGAVSCDELGLSASIMHVPTGLFFSGAYGVRTDDNRKLVVPTSSDKDEFYMLMGGIEQSFFPMGKSTLFGSYYEGNFAAPTGTTAATAPVVETVLLGAGQVVKSTDVTAWGIGFNQNVAAAAMDVYVMYNNYQFDIKSTTNVKANVNDLQTVIMGAKIMF